jgi:hypothetical protein
VAHAPNDGRSGKSGATPMKPAVGQTQAPVKRGIEARTKLVRAN